MEKGRDPAIKLFGATISLRPGGEAPAVPGDESVGEADKDLLIEDATPGSKDQDHDSPNYKEKNEPTASSMPSETQEPCADQGTEENDLEPEEQQNTTSNSQEKTPKKPDKILPCPRCNSLDTKFCYFNNYNVNQPRHFCKNCQRYWTAGGTIRNVPVGAGRRKSKSSTSHYRHITVPDAILQTVRLDAPDSIHHPPLKPNGTFLSFGSDEPFCESMNSVLNLAEKTMMNCNQNGFHGMGEQMLRPPAVKNGDEHSSASSVTASSSTDEGTGSNLLEPATWNHQGSTPQIPYFNGTHWPYPWSHAPAFCTSSFPIPFYPAAAYWGCTVPGTWSIPQLSPLASSPNSSSSRYGPNSPTLGKHSREGDMLKHSNSENGDSLKHRKQEGCLWIPKILRIDDPVEAAKSSIWATLGFKNDKAETITGGGLFKAFQEKNEAKKHTAEVSQVLYANPAALSRSLNFQESS